MNALKYFSAFPVIILSALQKTLIEEISRDPSIPKEQAGSRWHGEHRLFRLWLLAVVVNSVFSFYWDVEMDWGLKLCEVDTWFPSRKASEGQPGSSTPPSRSSRQGGWGNRIKSLWKGDGAGGSGVAHQRSPHPTPLLSHTRPHRDAAKTPIPTLSLSPILTPIATFGLRPVLHFDPLVYHLFTIIDLVLRFTWSLKLSSHLHTISEIESGVFFMEALELVRRWMWVFVRVEWEAVKMAESRQAKVGTGREGLGIGLGIIGHGRNPEGQVVWEEKEGR